METCPICGKEGKSVKYHIWRMHGEGRAHNPNKGYKDNTRKAWNKGLTKETDERIKNIAVKTSDALKGRPRVTPISDITKKKLSKIAIERGFGCGNSNSYAYGWYESPSAGKIWLESSYEYKVACELDTNNVNWKRPSAILYKINGKIKRYFPDFYLTEYNVYLDPKNSYLIEKDKPKIEAVMAQNDVKVIILDKDSLSWEKIGELV